MQNYEQIMQELEIEVPEDKKDALKKKMLENYRTVADYNKQVTKADDYKQSLDNMQAKLDGFEGVDVNDLKNQIQTLTTQLNDEKTARAADARKTEVEKMVNDFLSSTDDKGEKIYDFLNDITADYYRGELTKALDSDSAKGKSITDIFNTMITDKDGNQKEGIFVDRDQQQARQNSARFTTHAGKNSGAGGKKPTMTELMRMKNEDPSLDISQYM